MKDNIYCMPDNVNTKDEHGQYLKDIGYYKWNKPTKTPEIVTEHWCQEEIAQEVLIQYIRSKRYRICVGWFEDGKWWCDDEELKHPVIAWRRMPNKFIPKIHWEFKEWVEKATNEAVIIGVDAFGVDYEATGTMGGGEIVEISDVNFC